MSPEVKEFMERWPQLSKEYAAGMPGLFKPTLAAAVVGAGLGWLFARNQKGALKGALIGSGVVFAGGLIAETAFSFGAGAGATVAIQECRSLKPDQHMTWQQAPLPIPGMHAHASPVAARAQANMPGYRTTMQVELPEDFAASGYWR
jgi:hypothetical protein